MTRVKLKVFTALAVFMGLTLSACTNAQIRKRTPDDIFTFDHIFHYEQEGEKKSLTFSRSCKKWNKRHKDPWAAVNSQLNAPLIDCKETQPPLQYGKTILRGYSQAGYYYFFKRRQTNEVNFRTVIYRPDRQGIITFAISDVPRSNYISLSTKNADSPASGLQLPNPPIDSYAPLKGAVFTGATMRLRDGVYEAPE